jgi:flagellar basal body-associated protein FliL
VDEKPNLLAIIPIVILLAVIILAAGGFYYLYKNKNWNNISPENYQQNSKSENK